jgi:ketosteroid isomerase-like protein
MRILAVLLVTACGALLSTPVIAEPGDDDEQRLKNIQQQLARAWRQHDRAFIESILAPEWSVTQPDGTVLTRAVVLGTFFDAVTFDSNVIDDVSVMSFGDTAVVRGRTVASGTLNGAPVIASLRFTDVFIKRHGRWQAVASHASPLLPVGSGPPGAPTGAEHPFVGHWTADLSKSKLHSNLRLQSMTLQIAVMDDAVSIADTVVIPSGQNLGHGTTTFQTDGTERPHDELMPGLIVVARWHGSRVLETILTRNDGQVDRVAYEVSADGRTLTTTTSGHLGEQVIVFDRR